MPSTQDEKVDEDSLEYGDLLRANSIAQTTADKLLIESEWIFAMNLINQSQNGQIVKYKDQLNIKCIDNYGTKRGLVGHLMIESFGNKINKIYYKQQGIKDIELWFGYDQSGNPQMNEDILIRKFNAFRKKIERKQQKFQRQQNKKRCIKKNKTENILNMKRGRFILGDLLDDGNTEKYVLLLQRNVKDTPQTLVNSEFFDEIDDNSDEIDINGSSDDNSWTPDVEIKIDTKRKRSRRCEWKKQLKARQ